MSSQDNWDLFIKHDTNWDGQLDFAEMTTFMMDVNKREKLAAQAAREQLLEEGVWPYPVDLAVNDMIRRLEFPEDGKFFIGKAGEVSVFLTEMGYCDSDILQLNFLLENHDSENSCRVNMNCRKIEGIDHSDFHEELLQPLEKKRVEFLVNDFYFQILEHPIIECTDFLITFAACTDSTKAGSCARPEPELCLRLFPYGKQNAKKFSRGKKLLFSQYGLSMTYYKEVACEDEKLLIFKMVNLTPETLNIEIRLTSVNGKELNDFAIPEPVYENFIEKDKEIFVMIRYDQQFLERCKALGIDRWKKLKFAVKVRHSAGESLYFSSEKIKFNL